MRKKNELERFHVRLQKEGSEDLRLNGAIIPCLNCGALFKSFAHYGINSSYTYDVTCPGCGSKRARLGGV